MKLEATGKSVEIAIQNGLLECGLKREDVDVQVVDNGGLFKKAKVILTWGETKEEDNSSTLDNEKEVQETENKENVELTESEENEERLNEEKQVQQKPKRIVDSTRLQARGSEFLLGLAKLVDSSATVSCEARDNELLFSIKGDNVGKLIGYHGENLQAIQLILSGIKTRGEGPIRMYIDIDGYKQNRNQSIIDLANKVAEQAIKIERNIHLDPMSAYDRRIVHITLQDRDDVTTESTGEGEKRHVVVKPIFKK